MKKFVLLFLFLATTAMLLYAQTDSLYYITKHDSINPFYNDTLFSIDTTYSTTTSIFEAKNRPTFLDIELPQQHKNNLLLFVVLSILLSFITLLKVLFTKDFEELISILKNKNIATQIYRSQHQEGSFLSLFLIINFIVVSAILFVLIVNYFHEQKNDFSYLSLSISTFLFTFFLLIKVAILKLIGNTFDIQDNIDKYLFNYFAILKTIGIIEIPIAFIWLVSSTSVQFFLLIVLAALLLAALVVIAFRGLSTSINLMYKSLYHFLIYICIVELVPVFLLIKLLTKTAI